MTGLYRYATAEKQVATPAPAEPVKPRVALKSFEPRERIDLADRPMADLLADLSQIPVNTLSNNIEAIFRSRSKDRLTLLDELNSLQTNSYWELASKGDMIYYVLSNLPPEELSKALEKALGNPDYLAVQIQIAKGGGLRNMPFDYWSSLAPKIDSRLEESYINSVYKGFPDVPTNDRLAILENIRNNSVRDTALARITKDSQLRKETPSRVLELASAVSSASVRRSLLAELADQAESSGSTDKLLEAAGSLKEPADRTYLQEAIEYNAKNSEKTKSK